MEERKTIFDYAANVFVYFGFTMLCMMIVISIFGSIEAKEVSTFFYFGNEGIRISVMLQFLAMSTIIEILRYIFFTDAVIKKMSVTLRTSGMIFFVLAVSVLFIILFDWAPIDMWQSWVGFIVCFLVCFIASLFITTVKNKIENEKLEEGLNKMKEKWEKEGTEND